MLRERPELVAGVVRVGGAEVVHQLVDGRVAFPRGFNVAAENSVIVRMRFPRAATAASPSHIGGCWSKGDKLELGN